MPIPSRLTICCIVPTLALLSTTTSSAQPIELPPIPRIDLLTHTPDPIYQNQTVIRVRTTSQAQLDAMLGLVESVWSEHIGVGMLDVQIKRSNLPAITKLAIPYKILIDDLQASTDETWNQIKHQERLDRQRIDQDQRGTSVHDDAWFANYKQFADIIAYFNNIATLRPDLASMADIGDSIEGNDIYAITITAPDQPGNLATDRPVVLWHGTTHAREWISPMTVSYLASKFVDSYDTDPRVKDILDSSRLVIIPVTNPDGYLYTWTGNRFWRKNRRVNGFDTFGVDINRNWEYEWGGEGSSASPASPVYRGTGPFSEPETAALRDLSLSFGDQLVAHIDYHTYSQLILWPFGYAAGVVTPEPDRTFFDTLAIDLSEEIFAFSGVFYDPMQSVDLYPAAGNSSDWYYGELGAKSLTYELRPLDRFDPPPSIILPTAQENYEAAKLFVERTTALFAFEHTPTEFVQADISTPVLLWVADGIASLDPTSPTLFARLGATDPFTPIPMTPIGNGDFQANLPAAPCDTPIHYYFQVSTTEGTLITFPADAEFSPLMTLAQEFTVAFDDDMETPNGWTVGSPTDTATTGIWNRMDPQGTEAQPEDDHTIAGTQCWITDGIAGATLGERDIDGGSTTLTSPMLDAIIFGEDAQLVYWRWYSNNTGASPNEDSMLVEISNDNGNSWTTLETVTENAGAWVEKRFRVADFIWPTDQMRLRFIASDFFNGSIVEAGIDDLRIESIRCTTNSPDINGDGTLNFFDISAFLEAFNDFDPIADFNNDGQWNFFDISAFLKAFAKG